MLLFLLLHPYAVRVAYFNPIGRLCRAVALGAALAAAAGAANGQVIVVLGDSLTAGYGLAVRDAFPVRLQAALALRGHEARVIDAGVSGDTTAGGRARLDWALADKPDLVIVELGANDGLRGLPTAMIQANLDAIIRRLKQRGIAILLTGMMAPPNMGSEYGAAFNAVFPRLAAKHDIAFYRFFLEGVASRPGLNQADGLHPNAAGVAAIVDRIVPYVVRLLKPPEAG